MRNHLENTPKADDVDQRTWDRVAESREFRDLIAAKKIFIVPALVFFIVYYFSLPALVGYAPRFMAQKIWGNVNLAYLFALSQFIMTWIIAALYVRAADAFDAISKDIVERAVSEKDQRRDL